MHKTWVCVSIKESGQGRKQNVPGHGTHTAAQKTALKPNGPPTQPCHHNAAFSRKKNKHEKTNRQMCVATYLQTYTRESVVITILTNSITTNKVFKYYTIVMFSCNVRDAFREVGQSKHKYHVNTQHASFYHFPLFTSALKIFEYVTLTHCILFIFCLYIYFLPLSLVATMLGCRNVCLGRDALVTKKQLQETHFRHTTHANTNYTRVN